MKVKAKSLRQIGLIVGFIISFPNLVLADDGFSVEYYDSEADYFANSSSRNEQYFEYNFRSSFDDPVNFNEVDAYDSFYDDTIYSNNYGEDVVSEYTNEIAAGINSDIVYGVSSDPAVRLWSEEPLASLVTANQYRNKTEKKEISIRINGVKYAPRNMHPILIEGRVFVPLRFVAEQLGYTVSWDSEKMIAEINDGAIIVEVGSYTMWKYDGLTIPTDTPPFLYQGTLMVGLRQIGTALNYDVDWDEEHREVLMERARQNKELKQHNVFDRSVY